MFLMPNDQTNFKYILAIVILGAMVGGGIIACYNQFNRESRFLMIAIPKGMDINDFSQNIIDTCREEKEYVRRIKSDPACLRETGFRCADGWGVDLYYDKRKINGLESNYERSLSEARELLSDAIVAEQFSSVCSCADPKGYKILDGDALKDVSCETFFQFIEDYNAACGNCLLIWSHRCC